MRVDPRPTAQPGTQAPAAWTGQTGRFGICVPQVLRSGFHFGELADFALRAEELGFDSAWVLENIDGSAGVFEPLTLLGYLAACVKELRLGVAVLISALHNPVILASALATVDHMTGGKLTVGVGLGGQAGLYPAMSWTTAGRPQRFEESVQALRLLWSDTEATLPGEFIRLDRQQCGPKPVQRPGPPLWVGGVSERAIERAARLADGWVGAGSVSTAEFERQAALLRSARERLGRAGSPYSVAKRVFVALDVPPHERPDVADWFGTVYNNPRLADRVCVMGSPDKCVDELGRVLAAGADTLLIHPVTREHSQLELIAGHVIPQLASEGSRL